MAREIREATERLAKANNAELKLIVNRDPDMIRDVARSFALCFGAKWDDHADRCQVKDTNEFGPCTCGAEERYRASFQRA